MKVKLLASHATLWLLVSLQNCEAKFAKAVNISILKSFREKKKKMRAALLNMSRTGSLRRSTEVTLVSSSRFLVCHYSASGQAASTQCTVAER